MEKTTIELLTEFNINPENVAARQYYQADNLWKTLHIERDEYRHSLFLAWLFKHDAESDYSPLTMLLNLLVKKAANTDQMDDNLKMAILKGTLKVKSVEISNEKTVSNLSKLNSSDRLDIYIKCGIDGVPNYSVLEIIVENKVDAPEGNPKTKKEKAEDWEKVRYQTQRYYYACHEERKNDSTLQLFVFLSGLEHKPKDEHFITINYQDLVDYILEPYLKNNSIDNHTEMSIKEYLRILGNPYNTHNTILATTMEEKELLQDFYERNKDLFMRAVDVRIATTTDEDEKADLEDLQQTMKKTSGTRRHYTINGQSDYSMYQVIEEFAKHLMREHNNSIQEVDEKFKQYTGEKNKVFLSNDKTKVYRYQYERNGKTYAHYHEFNYGGESYYSTKEWGGDENGNFPKLMQGINKDFQDFQIIKII